jgi:O-antigen/teichoic acid export membrane protein
VSRSLLVVGLGSIAAKLLRLGALFFVLGVITKADLGVAQLALTVFSILQSLTELGLGAALIRTKEPTAHQLAALFWLTLLASAVVYAAVFLLAYLLAAFYDEPLLAPLIHVQALGLFFSALFLVPKSVLMKELRMGRVTLAENAAGALSGVLMIGLAASGLGIWSIVLGELSARVLEMGIYQVARPYFPRFVWDLAAIRPMLSFGLYTTGSRFLSRFYFEADYLVVGKMLGKSVTGIYAFAFRTVDDLVRTLGSVVVQVAFPTFARLQDKPSELQEYLYGIARGATMFIGTLLAFVVVFVDQVLLALDYQEWLPAVGLIRLFAIMGLLKSVLPIVFALLNALGNARFVFQYAVVLAVALPIGFVVGAHFGGAEGVAWAWIIVYPSVSYFAIVAAARRLEVGVWTFTRRVCAGLPFPLMLAGLLAALRVAVEPMALAPGLIATSGLVIALGAGVTFVWYRERAFVQLVFRRRRPKAVKEP